jgi:hypothetical protein
MRKGSYSIVTGFMFAISATSASAVYAQTYDAVSSFNGSNPSGQWSYLCSTTVGAPLAPLTTAFSPNSQSSGLANGSAVPNSVSVVRNYGPGTTEYNIYSGGGTYQPANVLAEDPESNVVDVQWTAPATANYSITGFFEPLDNNAQPDEVQVFKDLAGAGQASLFSDVISNPSEGEQIPFSLNQPLSSGETVDFVVNETQQYAFLSDGLSATISVVPEPASMGLLLACALMAFRRRVHSREAGTP